MFEFEYPIAFGLILLFILGAKYLKPNEDALLLSGLYSKSQNTKSYLWFFKPLAIIFLILSLSSPISKKEFFPNPQPSHAIMLSVDLSGSMRYQMQGGRKIDIAKALASEFVKTRKHDHVGAVAFGSFAYVASPLTYDTKAVSEIIKRFHLGLAGEYTALYDGLFMSIRMLKKTKAKEKIIILLTDGEDRGSHIPLDVLENAIKKDKVKIYTIGIGNPNDYNGRVLKTIAQISGGKFYQAISKDALENVYKQINTLEKTKLEKKKIVQKFYYYQYPLFLSFIFFILFLYFKTKKGKI